MSRSGALASNWAKETLGKIIKPKMKVVILGYSFFGNLNEENYFKYYGKNSEYAAKIDELFLSYNIRDVNWVYYFRMSKDKSIALINDADILYLPGGAPDLMYNRIVEKKLLDVINNFNKIVIGSSAGAMIQLNQFHISPDNEYHKFSLHQGLGYLNDFYIEVHYRRRRKQKSSMRKMRRTFLKPIYTIPDDGMLVIKDKKIVTLGKAKLMYNKRGIDKSQ